MAKQSALDNARSENGLSPITIARPRLAIGVALAMYLLAAPVVSLAVAVMLTRTDLLAAFAIQCQENGRRAVYSSRDDFNDVANAALVYP